MPFLRKTALLTASVLIAAGFAIRFMLIHLRNWKPLLLRRKTT